MRTAARVDGHPFCFCFLFSYFVDESWVMEDERDWWVIEKGGEHSNMGANRSERP